MSTQQCVLTYEERERSGVGLATVVSQSQCFWCQALADRLTWGLPASEGERREGWMGLGMTTVQCVLTSEGERREGWWR